MPKAKSHLEATILTFQDLHSHDYLNFCGENFQIRAKPVSKQGFVQLDQCTERQHQLYYKQVGPQSCCQISWISLLHLRGVVQHKSISKNKTKQCTEQDKKTYFK